MNVVVLTSPSAGPGGGGGGGGSGSTGGMEFQLVYRKPNGKSDAMRFSSEWRSDIVTR